MENTFGVRTDLAVEETESFPRNGGEISGVSLREWHRAGSRIEMTEVKILDKKGEKAMGKPMGSYITLEADQLSRKDEDYHREVSEELARQIGRLLEGKNYRSSSYHVLAVGLGNSSVTPDSLGPRVLHNLQVTRHLKVQYGDEFWSGRSMPVISGIVPGVMAQTGMESADVGNHRHSLTEESLGVPVMAIGVPTVVGAAAIVHDTVSAMIGALSKSMETKGMGDFVGSMSSDEQYDLIRELLEPEFGPLYVTPPDIDETVKQLSYTISEGIHLAFMGEEEE